VGRRPGGAGGGPRARGGLHEVHRPRDLGGRGRQRAGQRGARLAHLERLEAAAPAREGAGEPGQFQREAQPYRIAAEGRAQLGVGHDLLEQALDPLAGVLSHRERPRRGIAGAARTAGARG